MRSQLSLFMKFIDSPISFSPGQVLPQSPSLLPWFHLASQAEKVFCLQDPGPIKCLRAPSHQILAKSAPPKARNRDKVEFATKVRKSNINCCLTMNIKKSI